MANYNSQKEGRKVISNDSNQLHSENTKDKTDGEMCNSVIEERSKEDVGTEESIFSLKSPQQEKIIKAKGIIIDDQKGDKQQSINQLEDIIDVLIKEQKQLKTKLNDQDKALESIAKPTSGGDFFEVSLGFY